MRHRMPAWVGFAFVAAASAGLALPGALLLGAAPVPTASQSACDNLNTVCATSSAVAHADCAPVDLVTVHCSGSATVGGSGSSPAGLPGTVRWTGAASCSGTCGTPASGATAGAAAWPGLLVNGAGSEGTIVLGPVTQTLLTGCISYTVTAVADAHAETGVPLPPGVPLLPPLSSVDAPQAQDTATATICGPLG